jgi:hypothetical protein
MLTISSCNRAVLFVALFFLMGCDLFSFRVLYKPLIVVESTDFNRELSVQEFSQLLADRLSDLDPLSAKDPQIVSKFKEKMAADFIVDSLIEIWFYESRLKIEKKDLDTAAQAVIRNYPDDKSFRQELAELEMSYQQWVNKLELSLKRKALFANLQSKIDPLTEEEMKSFYENNKSKYQQRESLQAKSILLKDEAQAEIVIKLSKRKKFDDLIKEYSLESPALKDGIYGWVERDVSPELDKLFVPTKGEVIGPLTFNEGFRLFKVIQKRPARQKPYDDVKESIKREVLSLREAARFSAWLDEQIKRHKILKNTYAIDSLRIETRD